MATFLSASFSSRSPSMHIASRHVMRQRRGEGGLHAAGELGAVEPGERLTIPIAPDAETRPRDARFVVDAVQNIVEGLKPGLAIHRAIVSLLFVGAK